MKLNIDELPRLIREDVLKMIFCSQSGHIGGSLSVVEILTAIYAIADVSPQNPRRLERDRIVLSKGHACPALYALLAECGFFEKDELWKLRQLESMLQGHPDMRKTPGIDASTGSLGVGMSIAVGLALGAKYRGKGRVFTIIGDGEAQEGIIWEAAMAAGKYRLDNLYVLMDYNGLQIDGTNAQVMPLGDIKGHFSNFGWDCHELDGHNVMELIRTLQFPSVGKPRFLLCRTVKGKGISFMENKAEWHGKAYDEETFLAALKEVRENHG